MDKPFFKASDGGYFEMARVTEDRTKSGLQQDSEIPVPVGQKVRPEAFPNGLPMPVKLKFIATGLVTPRDLFFRIGVYG